MTRLLHLLPAIAVLAAASAFAADAPQASSPPPAATQGQTGPQLQGCPGYGQGGGGMMSGGQGARGMMGGQTGQGMMNRGPGARGGMTDKQWAQMQKHMQGQTGQNMPCRPGARAQGQAPSTPSPGTPPAK
jgi:hypothetical protein